jgi:hypothetical protein
MELTFSIGIILATMAQVSMIACISLKLYTHKIGPERGSLPFKVIRQQGESMLSDAVTSVAKSVLPLLEHNFTR